MNIEELSLILKNHNILSEYDGKPIKTRLPEELKERLKTKNQWLESGFTVIPGATPYELHPALLNKKLCTYYFDTEVQKLPASTNCCSNCRTYNHRYCVIAGEYVSPTHYCSEYEGN